MAQGKESMLRASLAQLLSTFHRVEIDSIMFRESLAALDSIYHTMHRAEAGDLSLDEGSHRNLFHLLAVCLNETRIQRSDHHAESLSVLADMSREPRWRLYLGRCDFHNHHAGWPCDPKHNLHGYSQQRWLANESQSILQVAVRTLHPNYRGSHALAAYHALRLIANACADYDANRKVVLECGVIELLLRCAMSKIWADTVTVALWNICVGSNVEAAGENATVDDGQPSTELTFEGGVNMSSIACMQLTLRSTGECDDPAGQSDLASEASIAWHHDNVITALLCLADLIEDEARKELIADLLEKASRHLVFPSEVADKEEGRKHIPSGTRLSRPDLRPKDFLLQLLTQSGRELATSNPQCECDVKDSIAIIVSDAEAQQDIIDHDLIDLFLRVSSWQSTASSQKPLESDILGALSRVRQSLSKLTYDLTALPSFIAKYGQGTDCPKLVNDCIDALDHASNLQDVRAPVSTIPAASACIVIANLTKSLDYALFLVHRRNVHLAVGLLLSQQDDPPTLFPALALLGRLAVSIENKSALFAAGIVHGLPRFLIGFNTQPSIQREAVTAIRTVIKGQPSHVVNVGVGVPAIGQLDPKNGGTERAQEQSGLLAALKLFQRTTNIETKLEIGRLVVEVCRTLAHSTEGSPRKTEVLVGRTFASGPDVGTSMSFLACNGPSEELRGEGWFGLAVLSMWTYGRRPVMESLADEAVQRKMQETMEGNERACIQNISMLLTTLQTYPIEATPNQIREVLEKAAHTAGLFLIWPVLAPAA